MKLYPLILLAATALPYNDSVSIAAAVNSPAQVLQSSNKQTGVSTQRFLRTDKAIDGDDEARMSTSRGFISMNFLAPRNSAKIASETLGVAKTTKLMADEKLEATLSVVGRPLRWYGPKDTKLDEALAAARSNSLQAREYVGTASLDGYLKQRQIEGKSVYDVFNLLRMKNDGYENFDMMKFLVLEKYRAMFVAEKTSAAEVPTLAEYLREIAGKDDVNYALLLEKTMTMSKDESLPTALNELFRRWFDSSIVPPKLFVGLLKTQSSPSESALRNLMKRYKTYVAEIKVQGPRISGKFIERATTSEWLDEELDAAWAKRSQKQAAAEASRKEEGILTPSLNGYLDGLVKEGKSVDDVSELLDMGSPNKDSPRYNVVVESVRNYLKFDMMRFLVLEQYRANFLKTNPKTKVPTLAAYLLRYIPEDDARYAMLLEQTMTVSKDPSLPKALEEVFHTWHASPSKPRILIPYTTPNPQDDPVLLVLIKRFKAYVATSIDPPTVYRPDSSSGTGLGNELNAAWEKSSKAREYVGTPSLDNRLNKWLKGGESVEDVFNLMAMAHHLKEYSVNAVWKLLKYGSAVKYRDFDMMEFLTLEKYRAMYMAKETSAAKVPPTLADFLRKIAPDDDLKYAMLLEKAMTMSKDSSLPNALEKVFHAWHTSPQRPIILSPKLNPEFVEDYSVLQFLVKKYKAYVAAMKTPSLVISRPVSSPETELDKALVAAWAESSQARKYAGTPLLDDDLKQWQSQKRSLDYVFEQLKMESAGYENFDMMKFLVLKEYRTMLVAEKTSATEVPPTLAKYLWKIAGEDDVKYALLLVKTTIMSNDESLEEALENVFRAWHATAKTPDVLEPEYIKPLSKDDHPWLNHLRQEYKAYIAARKEASKASVADPKAPSNA